MKVYIKISIAFTLLMCLNACSFDRLDKGQPAPDFNLQSIEGKTTRLSSYQGKVVLVHFWTDWCEACRAEFPKIQAYYSELGGENFELIAVNIGQEASVSKDFQKSFDISFPMLVDAEALTQELYAVEAYPTNFFISPDGKIIRRITGWVDKSQVEVIINQNKK